VMYGINVIQIVYNNGSFGTIRMHQEREFPGRTVATDLRNPDFAALANACGALGLRAESADQFRPALEKALAAGRPALIEVSADLENITTATTLTQMRAAH